MSPEGWTASISPPKNRDAQDVADIFGPQAKRYEQLQRTANGTGPRRDAAAEEVARMEDGLTHEQQNRLYGIGQEGVVGPDEVRDYQRALGSLDTTSAEDLGRSLKWSITKLSDPSVQPADMTPPQRLAYAQGPARVRSRGRQGLRSAGGPAGRGSSQQPPVSADLGRVDAAYMLGRFLKPEGAPATRAQVAAPELRPVRERPHLPWKQPRLSARNSRQQ